MGKNSNASDSGVWRVFCAIEIPADVAHLVARHINKLQKGTLEGAASWSRPDKLHLTLKFLGNIERTLVPDLSTAASVATHRFGPFRISIGGTGTFPKHGPARVLWLGIDDPTRGLSKLQQRLEDACESQGFPHEERPFNPHLTIARVRKPEGARELGLTHRSLEFKPAEFTVSELIVIRSELGKEGSKYSAVSRHLLQDDS